MKFNPYAVLLTTGALMLATVLFAQSGSSVALLKAGAVSVDRDVSSFAARTLSARNDSQRAMLSGVDEGGAVRVVSADPRKGVAEE